MQAYTFNGVAGALAGTASAVLTAALVDRQPVVARHQFLGLRAGHVVADVRALTLTYGVRWEVNPPPG